MTKPTKTDCGWSRVTGWLHGDEERYNRLVEAWNNRPRQSGRERTNPVHESWEPYLKHFNPSDPTRSQGAFARWLGVLSSSISAAKKKPITLTLEQAIKEWVYIGDGEGLDGSWNTNQDRK